MSWSMWHICGIGFDVNDADSEDAVKFLKNHEKTLKKIYNKDTVAEILSCEDVYALHDLTTCNNASEVFALIMREETGVDFDGVGISDDDEDVVLFSPAYPWQFKDNERAFKSEDELVAVMKPYAEELGLTVNTNVDVVFSG